MPNTLVTQEWVAKESLRQLYINCVAAQLVHRGFDSEFKGKKGDTARILTPVEFQALDFVEVSGIQVQAVSEGYVALKMDNHLDVSFEYGSKEKALLMPDFQQRYIEPAMKAIAEEIDRRVLKKMGQGFFSWNASGTPGTTANSKALLLEARKNLQTQLVPMQNRKWIMDPAAEAEYLELFSDADKDGSTAALREASLGRRFGLDTYMDQSVYQHTPGAPIAGSAQTLQVNAQKLAGSTQLVLKASDGSLTGDIHVGDKFSIAGVAGTYTVWDGDDPTVTNYTAGSNLITINFQPKLPSTAAADSVVNFLGINEETGAATTYTCNPIFHPGSTALAFAALEKPDGAAWAQTFNYKGFALRIVKDYNSQYKKEILSIDVLFGIKVIDGRLGTILLG